MPAEHQAGPDPHPPGGAVGQHGAFLVRQPLVAIGVQVHRDAVAHRTRPLDDPRQIERGPALAPTQVPFRARAPGVVGPLRLGRPDARARRLPEQDRAVRADQRAAGEDRIVARRESDRPVVGLRQLDRNLVVDLAAGALTADRDQRRLGQARKELAPVANREPLDRDRVPEVTGQACVELAARSGIAVEAVLGAQQDAVGAGAGDGQLGRLPGPRYRGLQPDRDRRRTIHQTRRLDGNGAAGQCHGQRTGKREAGESVHHCHWVASSAGVWRLRFNTIARATQPG